MNIVSTRRHDLDALRAFACYLLLLFHVGMVFNPAPFYHVRNADVSFAFLVLCGFISLWHMPLLFLLAGWSAAASLRARGTTRFLRERWQKLAVPLVAGCVLLGPGIKYLELRSGLDLNHRGLRVSEPLQQSFSEAIGVHLPLAAPFDESFFEFLPSFFTDLDRFTWSHLWFLAYLLTLTLALLPLFRRLLRARPGSELASRAWVYAPILPLAAIQLGLRERFPGPYNLYHDWASLSYFATFLVSGFLLAVLPGLEEAVHAERKRMLGLALAVTLALLGSVVGWIDASWVPLVGSAVAGWGFVAALLGFARNRVTRGGPVLDYLAATAFPVYVLHQPVVVALGFAIVALPLGIIAKFALLLTGSVAATLAIYHGAVRPFGPMRRLLGKPTPSAAHAPVTAAPARPALGS